MNEASSLMQDMSSEVSDIRMSLDQLQALVFGPGPRMRSRAPLLTNENIVVILTIAVLTFSEREKVIEKLKKGLQVVTRVRLALKEPSISKLRLRPRSSRESLSFMLAILTW